MSVHMHPQCGSPMPRLLIVGDIALLRKGIACGLERTGRFHILGSTDVSEAMEIVTQQTIDVVVLDTSRRRASNQARQLLGACPALKIVAFGINGVEDALACAEIGVRAFVDEEGSVEEIAEAAQIAAQGLSICPPELTARLLDRLAEFSRSNHPHRHDRLTARQDRIARMVAAGLSNKQIARELSISPATVKNHVHAILGKFDLPRRSAIGSQLVNANATC